MISDDLAALRFLTDRHEAVDRLEAEITRLTEQRDILYRANQRLRDELEARDDAELIGHAQDARDAVQQRYGQGLFPGRSPMERQMADNEYSPEHQDEYRRLWHRDSRRAEAAKAKVARLERQRAVATDWAAELAREKRSAEARVRALQDGLRRYDAWASRMPDAGFTDADPRWQWWHERPYDEARALLAEDGAA